MFSILPCLVWTQTKEQKQNYILPIDVNKKDSFYFTPVPCSVNYFERFEN